MKIIDAFWEKRNINLNAIEITLESYDFNDFDKVEKELRTNYLDKYLVLKIPVGFIEELHKLQNLDFYFMENIWSLGLNIKEYKVPNKFKDVLSKLDLKIVNNLEVEKIIDKIEDGMYQTDRISLDPKLDSSIGTARYRNWLRDLSKKNNVVIYETILKETKEAIGYGVCVIDEEEKKLNSLLTGLYKKYHGEGFGCSVVHSPIMIGIKKNLDKYETSISSNNINVVKVHFPFGMNMLSEFYVLRRFPKR